MHRLSRGGENVGLEEGWVWLEVLLASLGDGGICRVCQAAKFSMLDRVNTELQQLTRRGC